MVLPRTEEPTFLAMLEARGVPAVRIGVTDAQGGLEVQGAFSVGLDELREAHEATLPKHFA